MNKLQMENKELVIKNEQLIEKKEKFKRKVAKLKEENRKLSRSVDYNTNFYSFRLPITLHDKFIEKKVKDKKENLIFPYPKYLFRILFDHRDFSHVILPNNIYDKGNYEFNLGDFQWRTNFETNV